MPPMSGPSGIPQQPLSAFGVDLTPPNPIQYSMPSNTGDIKSVLTAVNKGQNDANLANNERYKQLLAVLQGGYGQAGTQLTGGFNSALGSLSNSLANNQTVYSNDAQRATQDAVKASSNAQQSGISRGLGNTTIMNTMQDQVQRAKNDAFANIAAQKAKSDNDVYNNISSIYQNKGISEAGLTERSAGNIGGAIERRNDVGPNIGDYAGLISGAAQAQNSMGRTTTRVIDPIPINSPLRSGGTGGSGGGIQGSQGNFSGGLTGGTGATVSGPSNNNTTYTPGVPGTLPGFGQPSPTGPISSAMDAGEDINAAKESYYGEGGAYDQQQNPFDGPTDASTIMPDSGGGSIWDIINAWKAKGLPPGTVSFDGRTGQPLGANGQTLA